MTDLRSIVLRLGGELSAGGTKARIPGPGHSKRDRSMSLRVTPEGKLLYYSFAGDSADAMKAHIGLESVALFRSFEPAPRIFRMAEERAERNRKISFCKALWARSCSSQGTLAQDYLRSRMIDIHTMPDVIRFCPDAPKGYHADRSGPAMVALVTDTAGQACGLHLTFLRPDGRGNAGRLMLGSVGGGSVRLFPVRPRLAIAEGIETALAYSYMKRTCCWAVLSTSGMTRWAAPTGCEAVIVAADNDKGGAGLRAATKVMETYPPGFVTIDMPEAVGTDWNDSVRSALAA